MALTTWLALVALLGSGIYFLLSSKWLELLLGVALVSNGVNLLLLHAEQESADPLPQALILTAIVIGFSILLFLSAFILKAKEKP